MLVVLVMLGVCATSFGNYFLIYNVSMTVKGVDYDTGGAVTVPMKGYFVLDLNDSDEFVDANLVLYGKNPDGEKVYVELDRNGNELLGGTETRLDYGYFFIYLGGANYFSFDAQLIGKTKLKDVGLGTDEKKEIASSVKGVISVWEGMLLDASQDISGTANISMTLNNAYTKAVNDTDPTWTQEQIIEGQLIDGEMRGIKPDLARKDYTAASLP